MEIIQNDGSFLVLEHQVVTSAQEYPNLGPITIGGDNWNRVVTINDRFDEAEVYTICGFKQKVTRSGATCEDLPKDTYLASPFYTTTFQCGQVSNDVDLKKKMDFICGLFEPVSQTSYIIALTLFIGSTLLFCCACVVNFCCSCRSATNQVNISRMQLQMRMEEEHQQIQRRRYEN